MPSFANAPLITPSYQQGFAYDRSEAAYPFLWDDLSIAILFNMGPSQSLSDFGRRKSRATATTTDFRWYQGGWTIEHNATGDRTTIGKTNDLFLTKNTTILVGKQKTDGTLRAGAVFGNSSVTSSRYCGFLAPWTDNHAYFDWGGTSSGNTRVSTLDHGSGTLTVGDDDWACTTGPRGMEIWQNGKRIAHHSTSATRSTNSSDEFRLGTHAGIASDLVVYRYLLIYNRQLSPYEIQLIHSTYNALIVQSPRVLTISNPIIEESTSSSVAFSDEASAKREPEIKTPLFIEGGVVQRLRAGDLLTTSTIISNPCDVLYLKGDADTDGSVRIINNHTRQFPNIEKRVSGSWEDTGLISSPNWSRIETSSDDNTNAMGEAYIYGVRDTSSARTITISSEDEVRGRIFVVNDESGGAATNNITVDTASGATIDGSTSYTISKNYGSVCLYCDGSSYFTLWVDEDAVVTPSPENINQGTENNIVFSQEVVTNSNFREGSYHDLVFSHGVIVSISTPGLINQSVTDIIGFTQSASTNLDDNNTEQPVTHILSTETFTVYPRREMAIHEPLVNDGTLIIDGSFVIDYTNLEYLQKNLLSKSTSYSMGSEDHIVECTSSSSTTITLPTAISKAGRSYIVKNSNTGTVTVDTVLSQTIDGSASKNLSQYDSLTVSSNGSNWVIT